MRIEVDNHTLAALVAADVARWPGEPELPTEAAERAQLVAVETLRHGDGVWALAPDTCTGRVQELLDAYDRATASEPTAPLWRRQRVWLAVGVGIWLASLPVAMWAVLPGGEPAPVDYGPIRVTNAGGYEMTCSVPAQDDEAITLHCPWSDVDR